MIRAGGIRIVLLTDAPGQWVRAGGRERQMRGFHCVDPSHGRIDFTGADDAELLENIKAHTAKAHPDLTDGQVRDMVAGAEWWRSMATTGVNAGSSPSAYDK